MKRNIVLLFALATVITMSGCEESGDEELSEEARIQQVLDRFEKNESMSYQMFDVLAERMSPDSLKELKAEAAGKEMFINLIARQTEGYFDEVIEGSSALDITTIPTPFSGEAEITLKGLVSVESSGAEPFDVIGEYSKKLLAIIKEQAASGRKDWVLIESDAVPGIKGADSRPVESLSLNFTKIEMLVTLPQKIIMNLDLTDEQVLSEMNDILNANEIPPIAIGLLLPAVQKFRNADTEEQPFGDALNGWLNGPITQAIGGGMNRDIIRRVRTVVHLAALHTIILDGYKGTTPDIASLSVLHARYRAALILGAEVLWKD